MSKQKLVFGVLGLACVGLALGALATRVIASRKAPLPKADGSMTARGGTPPQAPASYELDELAPDSTVFEPAPVSDRLVSARPHDYARRPISADDYGSINADNLGAAFLARVTDSTSTDAEGYDESEADELAGFQIVHPRG